MVRWGRVGAVALVLALMGPLGLMAGPSTAASVPSAPKASPASGNGWVTINWVAATPHGDSVLGYQVGFRRYVPATRTWTPFVYAPFGPSARARTVKYSNGTKVQLVVRARSAVGYSGWSSVTTVAGLPGRPPSTKAAAGNRTAIVSWSAAASNGSVVTGYRIHYRSYSGTAWSKWFTRSTGAASRRTTFTGLTNGKTYQFQVRAVNGRGHGPVSATMSAKPVVMSASAVVAKILADTNAFRVANGKSPLKPHSALNALSMQWAKKMHDDCALVHRSNFNVYPAGWSRAGENVAAGYSPTNVVKGWIASPGHRANLLGNFTHLGVGYYAGSKCSKTYFVQNFAKY